MHTTATHQALTLGLARSVQRCDNNEQSNTRWLGLAADRARQIPQKLYILLDRIRIACLHHDRDERCRSFAGSWGAMLMDGVMARQTTTATNEARGMNVFGTIQRIIDCGPALRPFGLAKTMVHALSIVIKDADHRTFRCACVIPEGA